jgi:hypothetical protein
MKRASRWVAVVELNSADGVVCVEAAPLLDGSTQKSEPKLGRFLLGSTAAESCLDLRFWLLLPPRLLLLYSLLLYSLLLLLGPLL